MDTNKLEEPLKQFKYPLEKEISLEEAFRYLQGKYRKTRKKIEKTLEIYEALVL